MIAEVLERVASGIDETPQGNTADTADIGFDASLLELFFQFIDDDAFDFTFNISHQLSEQGRYRASVLLDQFIQVGYLNGDHCRRTLGYGCQCLIIPMLAGWRTVQASVSGWLHLLTNARVYARGLC